MKQVKRILSLFLSAALVVTGVNLGTLTPVQAKEEEKVKDPKYCRNDITGTFYGTDGNQVSVEGADTGADTGNEKQAPITSYSFSQDGGGNWGTTRYGCLVFQVPEDVDINAGIQEATVTLGVKKVANMKTGSSWMRLALYETANADIKSGTPQTAYGALGYTPESPMWSQETVSNMEDADYKLHFDVTKAAKNINPQTRRLVLRVQVPKFGAEFISNTPATLDIDATPKTNVTVKYVDNNGKEIQPSKIVKASLGCKYTYDVLDEDQRVASTDAKYYIYDDENSQKVVAKIVSSDDAAQNIVTLKYTEITVTKQESEDLKLELCVGDSLPETVAAVFSDESTGEAKVEWDQDPSGFEVGQSYEVTGKFKGTNVPVKASVKVSKSLEQISENLVAWYPLYADAKDASGNGNDGIATGSMKFSKENGATFDGGDARSNMIQVPKEALDDLEVKDQMTFSFWTNIDSNVDKNRNMFGIGSVVNDSGSASKHFYINGALNAFMTANGWSDDAHKGFQNVEVSKNEWHYITVVLDGKKITLYVDKKKIGTEDTEISMTEAWNYNDGENRYLYIGNCAYGHNGDKDFKGYIKDLRIYNTVLEEAQIAAASAYKVPVEQYVEADILSGMKGVAQDYDGNLIITNVTTKETSGKITLPKTSYGNVAVSWKSENDAIDPATGIVTIPELNAAEKTGKLTAMVSADDGTGNVGFEFNCAVFRVNEQINVAEMNTLLNEAKNLRQGNYTAKTWTPFAAALAAAKQQARKPLVQADFDGAKGALETAKGNLVNIAALKARVAALENELAEIDKELYTQSSRDALNEKLNGAKTKMGEESTATQADITEALEGLPAKAVDALVRRGDKTALNKLITEATAVKANKTDYKEANWADFETALTAAEGEQEKDLVQTEVDAAVTALKDAMAKLEPVDTLVVDKAALTADIADAKAEAESLTNSHYTPETWTAYQEALAELEAIANKPYATTKDVEKAKTALAKAYAGLTPTEEQTPSADEKTALKNTSSAAAEEAKGMNQANYTKKSWERYQAALAAMAKAADNANVTKAQITAVTKELDEAKAALVDKSKLDKAIKDYGSLKKADYTTATWNAFETALNAAKAVSAKESATQDEVDNALTELNAKKTALQSAGTKVKQIKITANYSKVAAGKKAALTATITPKNATNKKVTWSIDDKSKKGKYATISTKGVLTTKKAGGGKTVTVTATAKDGSGKKATFRVKIMKNAVTKITLKTAKKVKAGKSITIKATVKTNGKNANKAVAWSLDKKSAKYASISSKGKLTAKKNAKGKKVTVTATSTDGTNKKAKVTITITK